MRALFTKLIGDETGVTAVEYGLIADPDRSSCSYHHDNGRHQSQQDL